MSIKGLFWVVAAFAAITTVLLVVWVCNGLMDWLHVLPREQARALTPLLLASSGVTAALAAAWRRRREAKGAPRDA